MLRCAGRKAVRVISQRVTASALAPAQVLLRDPNLRVLWHHQSRSVASWFAPDRALYRAAEVEVGGSGSPFGIATGVELEELEAQKEGKKRFDLDPPRGPFGTKEHPAIVESVFDERIVGCSGGVGEDEHDVTWFKLKKGEEYECSVCTQVFQLKVLGPGGPPGGHH